jgi:glycosyltransferase involved in cell wall biosynthesis
MQGATGVWVLIAAYNEATVIAGVVEDLRRHYPDVVLVDDGSKDNTGRLAAAAGAVVVTHPINLGQGAALQTGLTYALRAGARFVVTFDADGQHRPEDIAVLLRALQTQAADYALGSRFLGASEDMPLSRRLLLHAATIFTRVTTGLRLSDTHNGLRAMTWRGAEAIQLRQNRMAHASEILHQIAESRLKCIEAPVTIAYTEYSLSKGQRLGDAVNILIDLFARRLHR